MEHAIPNLEPIEPADWIIFATADWDSRYWTNKQHTEHHLATRGNRILYVESVGLRRPVLTDRRDIWRLWKRLKRGLGKYRQVEDNIWVYAPLVFPYGHNSLIISFFNQWLMRRKIQRFMREQRFNTPHIWTYHPFILNLLKTLRFKKLIYHCVDDLSVVPGVDPDFNQAEEKLLAKTDIVFTTSHALETKCNAHHDHVYFLPNVADHAHFNKAFEGDDLPDDLATIPTPRIGYVGVLSDFKVDFSLIHAVAMARPDWHWVLIGEEREGQSSDSISAMRSMANIHFLGYQPYATLPGYLRGFDVATLPTQVNSYTHSMFPMKYFEYLSSGVPVVSTPLEFTQTHQMGLVIAADAPAFEIAIEVQLRRGRLSRKEAQDFVGDNTWSERLKKMIDIIARS